MNKYLTILISALCITLAACENDKTSNTEKQTTDTTSTTALKPLTDEERDSIIAKNFSDRSLSIIQNSPKSLPQAMAQIDSALVHDKSEFKYYCFKSNMYVQMGHMDSALSVLEGGMPYYNDDPEALTLCGMLSYKLGKKAQAKEYYQKSLKIHESIIDTFTSKDKAYQTALGNKGVLLILLGRSKDVEKVADQINIQDLNQYKEYLIKNKSNPDTVINHIFIL